MLSPALRLQEQVGSAGDNDTDPDIEQMAMALNTTFTSNEIPFADSVDTFAAISSPGLAQQNGRQGSKNKKRKKRSRFSQALDKPRPKGVFNRTSLFECLWDTVIPPDLPVRSLRPCALCVADITYEDKSKPCPHVRYGTMSTSKNSQNVLQLDPLNKTFSLNENWKTDSTFMVQTGMSVAETEEILPDVEVRISLADGTYEEKQVKCTN